MRILGMAGSLRADSYNGRMLSAAADLIDSPAAIEDYGSCELPFYNEDVEAAGRPAEVEKLLASIESADALLFATPEYNHSVPAVLKNAIDWASRPAFKSVLAGKPCGMLSASLSPVGGIRAQLHLKSILISTLSEIYPAPDCSLFASGKAFDDQGKLTDAAAERRLARYVNDFAGWVAGLSG